MLNYDGEHVNDIPAKLAYVGPHSAASVVVEICLVVLLSAAFILSFSLFPPEKTNTL